MQIVLDRANPQPLYRQLIDQITRHIQSGQLAAGARLPTVRQLAATHGLTRLTVHSAYAELQSAGLVDSFVGRGTYVAAAPPVAPVTPRPPLRMAAGEWPLHHSLLAEVMCGVEPGDMYALAQAVPAPETYPAATLAPLVAEAASRPGALSYGPAQGILGLRQQTARLVGARGLAVSPDQIIITSGAQQAIDLALRAFVPPGAVVLVEEPTYAGAIEAAHQHGLRLVGVPVDADGLVVEALETICQTQLPAGQPGLLYTVATHHNPTGATLAAARRPPLLALARRFNLLIIEDDAYGLLGPQPTPALAAADDDGHVIHVVSFSKVLTPGLRLGALVAAERHLPALLVAKHGADLHSSPLLQEALAAFLERHSLAEHVAGVLPLYAERRAATLAALARHMPQCTWSAPTGGFCVWVTLPEGISEREFVREAAERAVLVAPGHAFYAHPPRTAHIRLSFGAHPPAELEQAVARLGQLLAEHVQRRSRLAARAWRENPPLV